MGFFSFRRRIKILPGLSLNLGKRGISTSIGPRGAKLTLGGQRGPRATIGIPGTGISYTMTGGGKARAAQKPPRGYKLGKVVVCPRCKNIAPYDPAMVGEKLHCPKCDHLFYLGRNVKEAWLPPTVKCRKCGALIEKNAKFCQVCGAKNRHLGGCGCLLYAVFLFLVFEIICGMIQAMMEK